MQEISIERIVRRSPVLSRPPEITEEVYWLVTGDGIPSRGLLFGTLEEAEAAAKLELTNEKKGREVKQKQ